MSLPIEIVIASLSDGFYILYTLFLLVDVNMFMAQN